MIGVFTFFSLPFLTNEKRKWRGLDFVFLLLLMIAGFETSRQICFDLFWQNAAEEKNVNFSLGIQTNLIIFLFFLSSILRADFKFTWIIIHDSRGPFSIRPCRHHCSPVVPGAGSISRNEMARHQSMSAREGSLPAWSSEETFTNPPNAQFEEENG